MTRSTPYRICVVCSGNICRSPIAEVVLQRHLAEAGLGRDVVVDSAGTGDWHVGTGADRRAIAALDQAGYDGRSHRARAYDVDWLAEHDLVIAADSGHLRQLRRWAKQAGGRSPRPVEIRLLREFDPEAVAEGDLELADPYYGQDADFDQCVRQVEAAAAGLVEHVRSKLEHVRPKLES